MLLPIHSIREELLRRLREGNRLVLSAPTGSGKTTQVPQFLQQSGQFDGDIVILQPRRLATRLVAERVAREMDCRIGELVGYQTRHDSKVSPLTRIRFLTEGLFLRQLQNSPSLRGISVVLLDEFHERNLATDVSLALVRRLQETGRPDLRLIVMSATLDVQQVTAYLNCPAIETHGRMYPVDIGYRAAKSTAGSKSAIGKWQQRGPTPVWNLAADALADLLQREPEGDVLVFMPGSYEIRRTIETCERLGGGLAIYPLYSELPAAEQDQALRPDERRKVIVSTNVAETSITIEGVRHVIDSGLARVNRFDPRRGVNVLAIEPVSRASAEQRAGRAGRTAPGTCLRLWAESEYRHRPAQNDPEIRRLDLAEVMLQLLDLGIEQPADFPWLESPDSDAVTHALDVLIELGAVAALRGTGFQPVVNRVSGEHTGKVPVPPLLCLTAIGSRMAKMPMHPRLSRLLVEAESRGCVERACLWAALISERDILVRGMECPLAKEMETTFPRSDFVVLERALGFAKASRFDPDRCLRKGIHANACREVERTQRLYESVVAGGDRRRNTAINDRGYKSQHSGPSTQHSPPSARLLTTDHGLLTPLAKCLLVAFSDHLSLRRNTTNLAAAVIHGRRGELDPATIAQHVGLVLPVEMSEIGGGKNTDTRTVLSLVTEIAPEWVRDVYKSQLRREIRHEYNAKMQAVEATDVELLADLPIDERLLPDSAVDRGRAGEILAEQIRRGILRLEAWDESVEHWIARVRCVAGWFPERRMVCYDEIETGVILQEFCAGAIRAKDLRDRSVLDALKGALSWEDQQFVERMAPERIELPRGWRMKVEYTPGQQPRGRAKIQDFYGMTQTPTIAAGRVKVVLELLAPNMRPVQTTEDLAGFWERLYPELKKALSRRYPRHEWL
ncbi:MAG: ATP-dependent RNA helicase [Tepidisphaeraceae bacterium]